MNTEEKINNILSSYSTLNLMRILILLIFFVGALLGYVIGKYNTEQQIQDNIEQIAQQYNNFIRINDEAYQITQVKVSNCFPYGDPTECTITNLRTFEQFNVYVSGIEYPFISQYANGYSDGFINGTKYMKTYYEENILPWTISTDSNDYKEYQKYLNNKKNR